MRMRKLSGVYIIMKLLGLLAWLVISGMLKSGERCKFKDHKCLLFMGIMITAFINVDVCSIFRFYISMYVCAKVPN